MAISIYRVYPIRFDNEPINPEEHLFSVIATESSAAYAAPLEKGLSQERIEMIVQMLKDNNIDLPTSPEDWVSLALDNMNFVTAIPVDASEYENVEDAISDEIAEVQGAYYIREDEAKLNKDIIDSLNLELVDSNIANPVTAAAGESCPPATQDIALNLKNRKNAIDTAMYGPLNPEEPNDEYWQALGSEWGVDVQTAKQQRCGNCAVFIVTSSMKSCISEGLTGENKSDEFDAIDEAGELGYCEAFDFKCASARTCRAWVSGGPIDDSKVKE
jgi:hypothetical protein